MTKIKIKQLPVFSDLLTQIISATDDDVDFSKLVNSIRSDAALSTLIIKVANSSLYSYGQVKTVQHAASIIGLKMIRSLIFLAIGKSLSPSDRHSDFKKYIWEHSLVTAVVAHDFCNRNNKKEIMEEAFTAGLLHDIGKAILYHHDSKAYRKILNDVKNNHSSFEEAEQKEYGTTHPDIGSEALHTWNVPDIYCEIALRHHIFKSDPDNREMTLMDIVQVSNEIAKNIGYGVSYADKEEPLRNYAEKIDEETIRFYLQTFPSLLKSNIFFTLCLP